ncbi:MAG: GxxExxY protein [Gemmataceae bacterium]
MKHEELTKRIIGIYYDVYNELGHGFLESVYQKALLIAFREAGINAEAKKKLRVYFRGQAVGDFEIDLIVEGMVLLETKGGKSLAPEHEAQILNYLRATTIEVGLLMNFGPKAEFRRFAFDNERKKGLPPQRPGEVVEKGREAADEHG